MNHYDLASGLLGQRSKLLLTEDYLEFENNGLVVRMNKEDIEDFKHGVDGIVWYEFTVGRQFSITFRDKKKNELKVVFKNYFGLHNNYSQVYTNMVDTIWKYYHHDIVSLYLDKYDSHGEVKIKGIKINQQGIELGKENLHLLWDQVGIKEYYRYFAIFNKENPQVHVRVSFNEYETEILWSVVNTIVKEKEI